MLRNSFSYANTLFFHRQMLTFLRDDLKITPSFMGILDSGGLAGNDYCK